MPDYSAEILALAEKYATSSLEEGLSATEAQCNLVRWGENRIEGQKKKSLAARFAAQFKDFMVIILLVAAAISFVVSILEGGGGFVDSIIILIIVIINAFLGVRQEGRAERALAALREESAPMAKVLRGGTVSEIPSAMVVPGDIILLEAGNMVPADGRLLESESLFCDESSLTGESLSSEKDAVAQASENVLAGDRFNMVFSGCMVTHGRGKAIVTATGMDTEMGRIAGFLGGGISETTPIQSKLNRLGRRFGILVIVLCAVIFVAGTLQGSRVIEMFLTVVSLAVAVIPEGLTMFVTIMLAFGARRMAKKNAVIRRLSAVETLGSVSVICSDKTGTLTQNRMTVQYIWPVGKAIQEMGAQLNPMALQVLRLAALCCDGKVKGTPEGEEHVGRDPAETAIIVAAKKNGLDKGEMDRAFKRVADLPFDPARKIMTTVHEVNGKLISVTKGDFDTLLPLCGSCDEAKAGEVNRAMCGKALRVIAVAYRELEGLPEEITSGTLEKDLVFIGMVGMADPPRAESKNAVEKAGGAGIRTVMITRDYAEATGAIATQLGIMENAQAVVSGHELQEMTDEELASQVDTISVYACVAPEDRIRIVRAWQKRGGVVAMTGDSVNDVPALSAADIGCAMGVTGTGAAKGASDIILTDDNFSTIVEAVQSGRGIYNNIKKTVQFLLATNLGELFTVFFAILLNPFVGLSGFGSPLLPIHLLLVNVMVNAFPVLALGLEPVRDEIMKRKPVSKDKGMFADGLLIAIGLQGAVIGILTLTAYYIGSFAGLSQLFPPSHGAGMTMAFLTLALSQLTCAINCRSDISVFKIGFFTNKAMVQSVLSSLALILLISLVPPLKFLFRLTNLSMAHWIVIMVLAVAPLGIVEAAKFILALRKNFAFVTADNDSNK